LKGTATVVDPYDADSKDEEVEVDAAKWTWGKSALSCPWVKEMESAYDFDIKKADKIFDFLLENKQLKLSSNHLIPSARELKGKRYCKFHNAAIHSTNECRVCRQHV
jgi:hypothetical protein